VKLLHIIATPNQSKSRTLQVSTAFLECLHAKYADLSVDVLDLFAHDLPSIVGDNIETKYSLLKGQPINESQQASWQQIEREIQQFLSMDVYLISTPMWNFSIPYVLKYYIDSIIQPGYLYRYNEQGQPVGLALDKKMVCITSRGGDYREHSPYFAYDFQEPYLRSIFGFVGITDIRFINAQPMDITPELREAAITTAIEEASSLANNFIWQIDRFQQFEQAI
jgi:FMN-dependent NADH-azoreductase